MFLVKIAGFKLDFESQFDLHFSMQYFASVSALTGTVAGIQSKKKGNDQEFTKYLINDCGYSWIICVCGLFYGLQTALCLAQVVSWAQKRAQLGQRAHLQALKFRGAVELFVRI